MKRLVIVGNSHVGALKEAWDRIGDRHHGIEVRFFAAPAPIFRTLRLSDRLLFGLPDRRAAKNPKSAQFLTEINGETAIDLSGADRVLLCGLRWPQDQVVGLLADRDVDGLRETGAAHALSRPMFDAACAHFARTALPDARWQTWTAARVGLLARALPSEACLAGDDPRYAAWRRLKPAPQGTRAGLDAFLDAYAAELRHVAIDLLRQPPQTLLDSGVTMADFGRGSHRLRGAAHPGEDMMHMNAAYGELAFEAILDWMGTPPVAAPALAATP